MLLNASLSSQPWQLKKPSGSKKAQSLRRAPPIHHRLTPIRHLHDGGNLCNSGSVDRHHCPGNKDNPKGYFEHIILREQVTKGILAGHGFDPLGYATLPPRGFNPSIRFNHSLTLRQTIDAIIRDDGYKSGSNWLYKGPKMSLLWRMYDNAFPNAIWIVVSREREGFVRSCLKTDFMVYHSADPSFWHTVADEYEQRLADLASSVATVP